MQTKEKLHELALAYQAIESCTIDLFKLKTVHSVVVKLSYYSDTHDHFVHTENIKDELLINLRSSILKDLKKHCEFLQQNGWQPPYRALDLLNNVPAGEGAQNA